jgi:myosin-5
VLDLIDRKHTGILALLDEQCIVPRSDDQKFTRYLYAKCDTHTRFSASAAQRVDYKFSIDHYAGPVEYSTDNWLEKNKDQMPSASVDLLKCANFELLSQIQVGCCADYPFYLSGKRLTIIHLSTEIHSL